MDNDENQPDEQNEMIDSTAENDYGPVIAVIMSIAEKFFLNDTRITTYELLQGTILMLTTLVAIVILALMGVIDNSGTIGLLGVITGYTYGGFFHKSLLKRMM